MLSVTFDVTQTMPSRNLQNRMFLRMRSKILKTAVQKLTDKYIKDVDAAVDAKSKEILTV